MKPLIYSVLLSSGLKRSYSNKKEALAHARLEAADGWPVRVRDDRSGEIIWRR